MEKEESVEKKAANSSNPGKEGDTSDSPKEHNENGLHMEPHLDTNLASQVLEENAPDTRIDEHEKESPTKKDVIESPTNKSEKGPSDLVNGEDGKEIYSADGNVASVRCQESEAEIV